MSTYYKYKAITGERTTPARETHEQFCEREMLRLNNELIEVEAQRDELLAACKFAIQSIDYPTASGLTKLYWKCKDAIAKAEGKQ